MNSPTTSPQQTELSPILGSHLSQFDTEPLEAFSFTDWLWRAINGELDLSIAGIAEGLIRNFFNELWLNAALIRQLLLIAVLSALIRCLSESFKTKSVGELGFYVSYIMIIATIFTSFRMSAGILMDLVTTTTSMMEAAVPLMISLTAMSGNFTGAAVLNPILFMGLTLMSRFISYIFIPLVTGTALLHIANHLTEGSIFTRTVDLMKSVTKTALRFMVFLFLSLLALHKISAPIANNLALRTARAAASAVPLVGNALNSAMDTVIHISAAARSGVLVALIIVISAAVSLPLIKLAAFMAIYKVTSALIQPICDERMVKCLDGLGDFISMLLAAGAMVATMFIFTAVIMLTF